ncbi:MAG: hypothetical protein M1829_005967 [Trizodia sp. TS-e1964]|nr:MAG: hypothetical protein M1829_005967 [Trizodia sp. TS-e1964]
MQVDPAVNHLERSILDIIVPYSENYDIRESLTNESKESSIATISQRSSLYFDEKSNILVVHQIGILEEKELAQYISRIAITLEVFVENARSDSSVQEGQQDVPIHSKDFLFSATEADFDTPITVLKKGSNVGGNEDDLIFIVWKINVVMSRPRVRIQYPSITMTVAVSLKQAEMTAQPGGDLYLASQVPAGLNLLEQFLDDPAFNNVKPQLSSLRLSRAAPNMQPAEPSRSPKKHAKRSFRALPAVNVRIRYSRINMFSGNSSVVASLDFEIMSFAGCKVILNQLDLYLTGGSVSLLNGPPGKNLKIVCKPRDDVSFLYRLTLDEGFDNSAQHQSNIRNLEISVLATAEVSPDCAPKITMKWTSTVDFSTSLNPNFGVPSQFLQRNNRPSSIPVTVPNGSSSNNAFQAYTNSHSSVVGPDTLPSMDSTIGRQRSASLSDFGVTITFSAPQSVRVGELFRWGVFIVNRSSRPRKIALVVVPRRIKAEMKKPLPRPPSGGSSKLDAIADAVADENIVYTMQKGSIMAATELVCLSTDLRVGPLMPAACHTAELEFIALGSGVLHIEAVRVVDLATQETTDIRDLPNIISVRS